MLEFQPAVLISLLILAGALSLRDVLLLRAIASVAAAFGLIASFFHGISLAGALGCTVVLAANGWRLAKEMKFRRVVQLGHEERLALTAAFGSMHSRDWQYLISKARRHLAAQGDVLIHAGSQTSELNILLKGQVVERCIDGSSWVRSHGTVWGELSMVTGQLCAGSPFTISVESESVVVLRWDYEDLRAICNRNPRLRAALMEGFVRAAGMRQGLVRTDTIVRNIRSFDRPAELEGLSSRARVA